MRLFSVLFNKSKMPFKIYLDYLSQPSRTLDIFARVNALNVEFKKVNLFQGEHFSEEFAKLNPLKKVPVLDDNGFVLTESVAIAKYLCRENPIADHWYPKDSQKQARVDEIIDWHQIGLRAPLALYVIETVFKPYLMGVPKNPDKIKSRLKSMVAAVDQLESVWLGDKQFLTGDEISLADLFAASEVEELRLTDYDPRDGRPKLAAWLDRVRDKCNPHYDKALERINEMIASQSKTKAKL